MAIGGFLTGPSSGGGGTTNIGINVQTNIDQSIRQFNQLNQTINNFANKANRNLDKVGKGFQGLDVHMRRINANVILLGFAFAGLASKANDFFQRGVNMELFSKRMETVSGSVVAAKKDIENIVELAKTVPVTLETLTKAFIKLKSAGIEPITGPNGQGPLKAMAEALAAFGGTDEQFDRAIMSIVQIAGKGVVMMEEIKQQLGEAVPTAIRVFARELNMTVAEFFAAVEAGAVSAEKLKDLFRGFEETYGGSSLKILDTFSGSVGQLNTALSILAKTIFVDTQTMRHFTGIVQLVTTKIYALDEFLKTPKGQEWIDNLWEGFKNVVLYVEKAISPIGEFIGLLGQISSQVQSTLSSLPPEVVGGGIIGFILFGKLGAVAGALYSRYSEEINKAVTATIDAISRIKASIDNILGTSALSTIALGGILGYLLAGPRGALGGAVLAALTVAEEEWQRALNELLIKYEKFKLTLLGMTRIYVPGDENKSWFEYLFGSFDTDEEVAAKIKQRIDALRQELEASTKFGVDVPVKINLPNLTPMRQLLDEAEQTTDRIATNIIKTFDGISEATMRAASEVKVKIFDAEQMFPSKEEAIAKLTELESVAFEKIAQLQDRASQLGDQITIAASNNMMADNLKAELSAVNEELERMVNLREESMSKLKEIKLLPDNAVSQIGALRDELVNYISAMDTSFQSTDQMKIAMEGFRERIEQTQIALQDMTLTDEQRAEVTEVLIDSQNQLASAMDLVNQKAQAAAPVFEENAVRNQQLANSIADLQRRADALNLGTKMEMSAQQVASAQGRIDSLLDAIKLKILQVQQQADKGLISQATAQSSISALERIAAQAEATRDRLVSSAQQADAAWQQLGQSILSAVEGAISDAIYGLVTGTKSMKDVLVDLWNAVTRAVANYIAKLIMASLFGGMGGGGGGGIFGAIFGGGAAASSQAMQAMQSTQMASMSSSTQQMAPQFIRRRSDSQQSGMFTPLSINIQAVDAKSVQELFMKHGSILHASINHRMRLNHQ